MSKKQKRSRHRIPPEAYAPRSAELSGRYAVEVEYSTNRLQRAHERAQKRLERARAKAKWIAATEKQQSRVRAAWAEVEKRLAEVTEIERLMQPGNHASNSHRGRRSYTPVPRNQRRAS